MTYIKKLIMQGFKSFAPKTEINFDKGINVIVGPNGSGKSNISDALCFVLGRLSIKSMRAAKSKNLLFMGTKIHKPAREASVEIVFDNSQGTFNLPVNEVSLKRTVKHNGQGVYKINNEVKTRSDVIETLAQAGIDPHGFNLVLQGQIQAIVKMHPEERRKIVEEVAGISIYESRKEKSLKELEKTELRLKEISTILRERRSFLSNLEKERSQALKYKELETTIKRCKASILHKKINDKERELSSVQKSISEKLEKKEKIKSRILELQNKIDSFNESIAKINKHIQRSTGVEQESLRNQVSNLRAEIEGLKVRRENYENRSAEIQRRIAEMEKSLPGYETEIKSLRRETPIIAQKQEELRKKKKELQELEEEKRKIYSLKTELSSVKERIKDKEAEIQRIGRQSDLVLKEIESLSSELEHETLEMCYNELEKLKKILKENRQKSDEMSKKEIEANKLISSAQTTISHSEEIKSKITKLDVCPLCQNKMTEQHVFHVTKESDSKIFAAKKSMNEAEKSLAELAESRKRLLSEISSLQQKISALENQHSSHQLIEHKKSYMKNLVEHENSLRMELSSLISKRDFLQAQTLDTSRIDEKYAGKIMEIEEISARTSEDLDKTLMYKERELEKIREVIKLSKRDLNEMEQEIFDIQTDIEAKSSLLELKEAEDKELSERFRKLFAERDSAQEKIQQSSLSLSEAQTELYQIEDQINYLKVGNAKLGAEKEALEMEIKEYSGAEIIKGSLEFLQERLKKSQEAIQIIGSINMRALEVYDEVKQEYDKVQEKVETLEKEKLQIMGIIEEIDKKKKRTFMKTYKGINELFSSNFSRLSSKGRAFLEIEDNENIFEGGVNIVVKLAKGKYFDVTSLSGGEQTLIAISLLFAIQEYRPYHFYILDEIDAALDKRNSERLSALLRKYMTKGQYIVITHNDALIMDSNILYGVSMHDGISKVFGLKLDEEVAEAQGTHGAQSQSNSLPEQTHDLHDQTGENNQV